MEHDGTRKKAEIPTQDALWHVGWYKSDEEMVGGMDRISVPNWQKPHAQPWETFS